MPKFKPIENYAGYFLAIDPSAQFEEDSIEKLVNRYVEEKVNIEKFEKNYNNDEKGARAINPKVILKVVFYSYIKGIQSLRKMEEMTKKHIAYIYLTGNMVIDHTTIAKFLTKNRDEIASIFSELLIVMNELGMIDWSRIVIDGTKIKGNASKDLTGDIKRFEKKLEQYKELSRKLILRSEKLEKDESIEYKEKEKERDKIERQSKKYESVIKKIEGYKKEVEEGKVDGNKQINLTDRESALLKTMNGFIQGYNVQTTLSNNDIIVNIEATNESNDSAFLEKMLKKTENIKEALNVKEKTEYSLDRGYFNSEGIVNIEKEGISVYVPIPSNVKEEGLRKGIKIEKEGENLWLILENGKKVKGHKKKDRNKYRYNFYWKEDCKQKHVSIVTTFIDEKETWERYVRKMESEEGKMKYNKRIGKEHNFDTLKNVIGLSRIRRRGIEKANLEAVLAAIAYNLCKFLSFMVENKLTWAKI